ncbi:hypothetical protein QBC34DRAFT_392751 [Podospora aff. communis PSN243]|uniref:Uncharacterized protein n=1 Tax=Podospora aff. communis PSN243 TaxID=3040156 RepID=A0AAV9H2G9_9PEZI|nr:hypothetical protein QBC34DRAFT_392751 [Podospora aff. communis PSN243]
MLLDQKTTGFAAMRRGPRRKRGFCIDIMVAFAAAVALTVLYVNVVTWAQQPTLVPWAIPPIPVGSIVPSGWLLGEMETMAQGLAGHEHDFYDFVNESRWLQPAGTGGTDYSRLNEALPYWFNGLVPLAYLLDDERLKTQVHSVARTVLDLQTDDGWLGPEVLSERNFWARAPFFLGLIQLAEANSTWRLPIISALHSFNTLANSMLHNNSQGHRVCPPNFECYWGQTRVHDLMISIQWLIDNQESTEMEPTLVENMHMFYDQSDYKWDKWYQDGTFLKVVDDPTTTNPLYPYLHGVNVGQGLKASAVVRRFNHDDSLIAASQRAVEWTMSYHGAPSGTILGDEIERDLSPFMGSELCTAVETAYSFAYLYHSIGQNGYADRAEVVIFNALPVMLTGDHWAHQYLTQPNGPWAAINNEDYNHPDGPFLFTTAHSGRATTFGMEPQYPCCTVNHPQGYPKFVTHSWGYVGENGLAHLFLGPSKVSTPIATVECDTAYPFDHSLRYTIQSAEAFDFYVRVPWWHDGGSSNITIGGVTSRLSPDQTTGLHRVEVPAGTTEVTYSIGASIRMEERVNGTVAVFYGNLLYALDVGSINSSSLPHRFNDARGTGLDSLPFPQVRDYYFNNTKPWNVAIDTSTWEYHGVPSGVDLPKPIFDYGAPPNYITVQGCEIAWDLHLGVTPGPAPANRTCLGARSTYRLIPYGSAKVHMSEIPTL